MKMKKLTALALAGALCMGMSATAFAADSVTTKTALDAKGNVVENYQFYDAAGNPVDQVKITDTETTINNLNMPADQKAVVRYWNTDQGQEALKDAIAAQKGEVNADAPIAIAKTSDVTADVNWEYLQEDKKDGKIDSLQVKFNVTDLMINSRTPLTDGDILNLMHWVNDPSDKENGGRWVCIPTVLKYGEGKDRATLYATAKLNPDDELSPMLFVVQKGNGTITPPKPEEDPSDPTDPSDPSDPTDPEKPVINDGKVTIDDIANAVVKKLQATNSKVVRVSSGVSPKTGE